MSGDLGGWGDEPPPRALFGQNEVGRCGTYLPEFGVGNREYPPASPHPRRTAEVSHSGGVCDAVAPATPATPLQLCQEAEIVEADAFVESDYSDPSKRALLTRGLLIETRERYTQLTSMMALVERQAATSARRGKAAEVADLARTLTTMQGEARRTLQSMAALGSEIGMCLGEAKIRPRLAAMGMKGPLKPLVTVDIKGHADLNNPG